MLIGVPSEIKHNEERVSLTPEAVGTLIGDGHRVVVARDAGNGSGFSNEDYERAGAEILDSHNSVFTSADIIVKVKEILPEEYELLREGKIILTYLHLTEGLVGAKRSLTEALLRSKVMAFSYDTVQLEDGSTPLLAPMSAIAGHMGVIMGAYFLQSHFKGKGVMLGRTAGCRPVEVVVIGGGSVGTAAAKTAVGLGANVTVLDVNMDRLRALQELLGDRVTTLYSNERNVGECVRRADVVVNAVFFKPTVQKRHIVTREMVRQMDPGSVIVDIGCDEEGAVETCRGTKHEDPIYVVDDVIHYCVPNIPGAVPRTASYALSNAILPYVREVANKGWVKAVEENLPLRKGLSVANGKLVHKEAAECQDMEWYPLDKLLKEID